MSADRMKRLFGGKIDVTKVSIGHGGEGGAEDPAVEAAKDVLQAIKSNDAEALSLALEDHYRACESSKDSGSDDSDEGGDEYGE